MFDDAPEALDDDELNKLVELTEEVSFLDDFVPLEGNVRMRKYYHLFVDSVVLIPCSPYSSVYCIDPIEEVPRVARAARGTRTPRVVSSRA